MPFQRILSSFVTDLVWLGWIASGGGLFTSVKAHDLAMNADMELLLRNGILWLTFATLLLTLILQIRALFRGQQPPKL
jgi:hypothetical protein